MVQYFFIVNLALQKTIFEALVAVLAVTIVDYLYISLSIFGIGKLLEKQKIKKTFGIISSIAILIVGLLIIKNTMDLSVLFNETSPTILSSFVKAFLLTILNPLTIILFTGIFASKAIEYNYTKKELCLFGVGTGAATFIFMGASVILVNIIKKNIPLVIINLLNFFVGIVLVEYSIYSLIKIIRSKK